MIHHAKKVLLTTDRSTYERVRNLKPEATMTVEYVNDIVSSFRGESVNHHTLRRTEMLRRMYHGSKLAVRCEAGMSIDCIKSGDVIGSADACSGKVVIGKTV